MAGCLWASGAVRIGGGGLIVSGRLSHRTTSEIANGCMKARSELKVQFSTENASETLTSILAKSEICGESSKAMIRAQIF